MEEPYPYLILDARYEKVRENGVVSSCAVLIAIRKAAPAGGISCSSSESGVCGDVALKATGGAEFTGTPPQGNVVASVVVCGAETALSIEALAAGLKARQLNPQTGHVNRQGCVWYQESSDGQNSIHTYFARGTMACRVSLEAPAALFAQCMPGYQHMLQSLVTAKAVRTRSEGGRRICGEVIGWWSYCGHVLRRQWATRLPGRTVEPTCGCRRVCG